MYERKRDPTIYARVEPMSVIPASGLAEADHAMAYARALFARLTGYPAARPRDDGHRIAVSEANHALAYAEETLARMKGYRPEYRLEKGDAGGDLIARRRRVVGREVRHALAYAKDLFKRLRGLPATAGSSVNTSFQVAEAVRRALARLARTDQKWVLERYVRGRRRRIAIAQLEALDDRLLADIGLTRNDIEPTVDRMLAAPDVASPTLGGRRTVAQHHAYPPPQAVACAN